MKVGLGKVVGGQGLYVNQHTRYAGTHRSLVAGM